MNLVFDLRLMQKLSVDPRWVAYAGEKLWLNSEAPGQGHLFPGVTELRESLTPSGMPLWSRSLKDGLYRRSNAGASALNIADILGADPILLLGYDMGGDKALANWHEEYERDWRAEPADYDRYLRDYVEQAGNVRARVFNLNPASKLRIFPFARLEEVL